MSLLNDRFRFSYLHQGHHYDGPTGEGNGTVLSARSIEMVEGNMGYDVFIDEHGKLSHVNLIVHEVLRHFESTCVGKSAVEIAILGQRICGVCPFQYAMATVKSIERVCGIEITPQAFALRELAVYGNMLNSHTVHIIDLMLPRILNAPSIIPIAQADPELGAALLSLHKLGNDLGDMIGGRTVHGTTIVPGGMSRVPSEQEFRSLLQGLYDAHVAYDLLVALYADIMKPIGSFKPERKREFIAVCNDKKYSFYSGLIQSSEAGVMDASEFAQYKDEYVVDWSTAKQVRTQNNDSYMVGALARINLNEQFLCEQAKDDMRMLGLELPCYDPFANTLAQIVEGRQVLVDAAALIEQMLHNGLQKESPIVLSPQKGYEAGYLEAPRGLIWHEYWWRNNGLCDKANFIIPTGMNTASMRDDIIVSVEQMLIEEKDESYMRWYTDFVLGSYDPFNSCATHYVYLGRHDETLSSGSNHESESLFVDDEPISSKKIAIVSIGNALYGDDGIGELVVEACKGNVNFPSNVSFIHGGVVGLPLFYQFNEYDAVIFVDAVDGLESVGKTAILSGEELLRDSLPRAPKQSVHEADFVHSFITAVKLGVQMPKVVRFIGVQIGSLTNGELSPELDPEKIASVVLHEYEHLTGRVHTH